MKKGCLLFLLVPLVFFGGLIGLVYLGTMGVVKEADSFLTLTKAGDLKGAYHEMTDAYQTTHSQLAFERDAKSIGLDQAESWSWTSRAFKDDTGSVEGKVQRRDGEKIPLRIALEKKGEAWRVASFAVKTETGPVSNVIPGDAKTKELCRRTLARFATAVAEHNFSDFYDGVAALWKPQTSPQAIARAFQKVVESGVDFRPLAAVNPVLDAPPALDERGFLKVRGYFPGSPVRARFSFTYAYEHPEWKLVSIEVKGERS